MNNGALLATEYSNSREIKVMRKISESPLGKEVEYKGTYDAGLLFPINRQVGRSKIGLEGVYAKELPFRGVDIWNCFEVSWLSEFGKPCVRILRLGVPYDSPNIVESKSLKLYLGSFNNSKFVSEEEVLEIIRHDLAINLDAQPYSQLIRLGDHSENIVSPEGICLDDIDIQMDVYEVNANMIKMDDSDEEVTELLYSDLMRSNCLITGQPDWATIVIQYEGKKINHKSLLEYIISFRNHIEFHEQCIERIFTDIMHKSMPKKLTVQGKYTRRGGIDINPIRSTQEVEMLNLISGPINIRRFVRQ